MKKLTKVVPNQPPRVRKEVVYGGEMYDELAVFIRSEAGKMAQCKMFGVLMTKASEQNWIKWHIETDGKFGKEVGLDHTESQLAIEALLYFGLIEFHKMWKAGGKRSYFSEHLKVAKKGFERWNHNKSTPQP